MMKDGKVRYIAPPEKMDDSFAPFGRSEGLLDWSCFLVEDVEDLVVTAAGTCWNDSKWKGVHISKIHLEGAQWERVRFEDCQSVSATLKKSKLKAVVFEKCLFGYWTFESCKIEELLVTSGSISGCTFQSCEVGRLVVTGKAKSEKVRFKESQLGLFLDPASQGNLFVEDCTGVVIFSPSGVPNRLFNRSSDVRYYRAPSRLDAQKAYETCRVLQGNVRDRVEDLVNMGVIHPIQIEPFTVVALRDRYPISH